MLLTIIVSKVSWRSRRNTWRRTRRFEDSNEPGKQPFDHDEPFYIIIAFLLLHWAHDIPWMATLLGLPPLHTPLILALFMNLPLLELCWWVLEISIDPILMKSLWSFLGQRYPRKVKSIFLEHFYFCLVVLLIMVAFNDSWRSRRNARSWTRDIEDLEDFVKTGKQPFDHDEPFYIIIAFRCFTEGMIYLEWQPC